jgi:hypothetical protein
MAAQETRLGALWIDIQDFGNLRDDAAATVLVKNRLRRGGLIKEAGI